MSFFVYLLKSISPGKIKTYVGYTNNLTKRLFLHNNNKGAKSTRGLKWKILYKKKFVSKSKAMSYEYKLKHNKILRKKIIKEYD
jgi:putative endonuclease